MAKFDLEKAIEQWKKELWRQEGLEPGYIEELESHLRDRIDDYLTHDLSPSEAFYKAKERSIPDPEAVARDFFYSRGGVGKKPPWEKRKPGLLSKMPINIKVALRAMARQKAFSFINIIGLAIGLAACLLMVTYISHELSYDRFYKDSDRIYRIAEDESIPYTTPRVGIQAKLDFPEIEEIVRIKPLGVNTFSVNGGLYREPNGIGVDSTFHKMFSIRFIEGNPDKAWTEPNSVVLTESLSKKYFKNDQAYGELIRVNGEPIKVTGVVEDPPQNTHLKYQYLLSFEHSPNITTGNWFEKWYYTYAKLVEGTDIKKLEAKLPDFKRKYAGADLVEWLGYDSYDELLANRENAPTYTLKPLTDIHLHYPDFSMGSGGDLGKLYTFSFVALFILIIACVNFMNLSTAKSAVRLKEIGVRKVFGSKRRQLVLQFLTETLIMSIFAMLIALILSSMLLETYSKMAEREFTLEHLIVPEILICLFVLTLIVGLLAGCYPAFYMSSFKPIKALKGELKEKGSNAFLRKGLVVFQFSISILLIICTLVAFAQLNYMQSKSLGINTEQVLIIKNAAVLGERVGTFKNEVLKSSKIESMSYSFGQPFESITAASYYLANNPEQKGTFNQIYVDQGFWSTYGIKLKEGRLFDKDIDAHRANYIINQKAHKWMGGKFEAGKTKIGTSGFEANVVGVVEDFHFESLKEQIKPLVIKFSDPTLDSVSAKRWGKSYQGAWDHLYTVAIRINGNYEQSLYEIREVWSNVVPEEPLDYTFLDDTFYQLYESEKKFGRLFLASSVLAITIALLGLFALTSFTLERRLKELAVRKVLGATITNLVSLIIQEFTKMIAIASILVIPLGYLLMNDWLEDFAYRVNINPFLLLLPGLVVMAMAWIMVGFQSAKTAFRNPASVLRSE